MIARAKHWPQCPACRVDVRLARDAAGAIEFDYCPRCGDRRYFDRERGLYSEWASNDLWRMRHHARRVVDVMLAFERQFSGRDKAAYRREVFAQVARWIGVPHAPHWHAWTKDDCLAVLRESEPVVKSLADGLVEGGDRLALHTLRAKRSMFPRLTLIALITRDRARIWLRRWIGVRAEADPEDTP